MEPKSHQSRLKSVKRRVWKPTPKNKQKKCRKGSPRTLQSRAFVQEGSQKSLNPVVPKKHRKRLQNGTQNGAKSHQNELLGPPRERHKKRHRKVRKRSQNELKRASQKHQKIIQNVTSDPSAGPGVPHRPQRYPPEPKSHQKASKNM